MSKPRKISPLTINSRISIRWTTRLSDIGSDGRVSDWFEARPGLVCGLRSALWFEHDLDREIGACAYRSISYRHMGWEYSHEEIRRVVAEADRKALVEHKQRLKDQRQQRRQERQQWALSA